MLGVECVDRKRCRCEGAVAVLNLCTNTGVCPYSPEEAVDLSAPQWEDINVVTGALKLFFRELPDPVIPSSLYQKFIDSASE